MKRIIALLLAATLCIGAFAGCSFTLPSTEGDDLGELTDALKDLQNELEDLEDKVNTSDDGADVDSDNEDVTIDNTRDEDNDDEQVDDVTDEPSREPADEDIDDKDETTPSSTAKDISPVDASLENPAEVGEWVKISDYSVETGEYHPIYYRIVELNRDAQDEVDDYNASIDDEFYEIPDLSEAVDDASELEYCSYAYEVYYPEDFPISKYGTEFDGFGSGLSLTSRDGGSIESETAYYYGLPIEDVSKEVDISEGGTIVEGKVFFGMVKGSSDYLIKLRDSKNDTYAYLECE